jgi:protein-tyrosine phosphatase
MAEYVMKDMVKRAGLEKEFQIASAATHYDELGSPVYPPARRKMNQHGIHCSGHCARLLNKTDYERWDYLIGMDSANLRNMHRICGGDPKSKMSLLLNHAGMCRDVADPWYTGDFEATWRDVKEGCEALLKKLCPDG